MGRVLQTGEPEKELGAGKALSTGAYMLHVTKTDTRSLKQAY